jgi:hypothetical protein
MKHVSQAAFHTAETTAAPPGNQARAPVHSSGGKRRDAAAML